MSDPSPDRPVITKRPASTDLEVWAQTVLCRVAGMDPDGAAEHNGVGFNANDTDFGRSLADQLAKWGRLSEKQWAMVVRLATKYRGQAPDLPVPMPAPVTRTGAQAQVPEPAAVRIPATNARETKIAEVKQTIMDYEERLLQILDGNTESTDDAHGARCLRDAPGEPLWLVCRGCPVLQTMPWPKGANSVCYARYLITGKQAELARLGGDETKALSIEAEIA